MKKNKGMTLLAVSTAALMLAAFAGLMSGCGGNNTKTDTSGTAATTAVESSSAATESNENASEASAVGNNAAVSESDEEKHGNITSEKAAEIALQNCPYGLSVTACEPATYDGEDCWHAVVRNTTGLYVDCYVSSTFCYTSEATGNEAE